MSEFEPVVLVHPDGREYTARTAAEANDLQFGHGYKPKSTKSAKATTKKDEAKS